MTYLTAMAAAAAGSANAQDTTESGRATMDTTAPAGGAIDTSGVDTSATSGVDTSATRDPTDTSGVKNPSGGPPASPGAVEDQATGTYEDSTWQDTTGADQNPAGYQGMERQEDSSGVADSTP